MSQPAAAPQIVHESETQRQHVRVQIPARAEIASRTYNVRDLSVSGVSVEGVETPYIDGAQIAMTLTVPFESFALNVSLKAYVTHYDSAGKVLGCKFTDLSREQLSILNSVIQSYMSGVIIKEGDILNVVARDNFVKIRRDLTKAEARDVKALAKRALPFLFMLVAAILGGSFVMGNVYEKMLILKSYQAIVQAESVMLRSPAAGIFRSALAVNTEKVTKGQVLGSIEVNPLTAAANTGAAPAVETPAPVAAPAAEPALDEEGNPIENTVEETAPVVAAVTPTTPTAGMIIVNIVSPCDCYITRQYAQDGIFRNLGESLFKMLPADTKPLVKATIAAEDVVRVNLRDKATMRISGEEALVTGVVTDIEAADSSASKTIVTIKPERPLSYQLTDRPVYVEFYVH